MNTTLEKFVVLRLSDTEFPRHTGPDEFNNLQFLLSESLVLFRLHSLQHYRLRKYSTTPYMDLFVIWLNLSIRSDYHKVKSLTSSILKSLYDANKQNQFVYFYSIYLVFTKTLKRLRHCYTVWKKRNGY